MVALKCAGDAGSRVVDVRWDTCRRVAELVVLQQQRRRHHQCPGGGVVAQLKVVTPITADGYATMDPSKVRFTFNVSSKLFRFGRVRAPAPHQVKKENWVVARWINIVVDIEMHIIRT